MKQDLLSKVLIFAAGATIGSVVTYVIAKHKFGPVEYEEYYGEDETEGTEEDEEPISNRQEEDKPDDKRDMIQYNKIINGSGYSADSEEPDKKEVKDVDRPYKITVDDYAELEDYETVSLYYYADGVVTDQYGNVIDDVDDIVGEENLSEFEEDEDCDSIYVRNDALKSDYEILRDIDNFSDHYQTEV